MIGNVIIKEYNMINEEFFGVLKKEHDAKEIERKAIIGESSAVLHSSKRVIFALHRGETEKAVESLGEIESALVGLEKKFGGVRLNVEGSYKAGVEEYVEAKMLYLIMNGEGIDRIGGIEVTFDSYLSGLCDVTGELVRFAVNKAAKGEYEEARKASDLIGGIMGELVEFDMTGYLRTKYDQARGNLRKVEQIIYEIREK